MFLFALTVIASSFAGARAARRIHPALTKIEAAGLGLLLGFGGLAWTLQILHAVGIPPGTAAHLTVSALAGAIAFGAFLWNEYRSLNRWRQITPSLRQLFRALPSVRVSFLATLAATVSAVAMYLPVLLWDAQSIWVGKARGLVVMDSLDGILVGQLVQYPIGLPILMAGAIDLGGEPAVKWLGPLFSTALAAVVLGATHRGGSSRVAMLTVAAMLVVPFTLGHTLLAFADMPMSALYVASAIYLIEYLRTRDRGLLLLSALLLGATALMRWEAPLPFAVNFAALLLFGRSSRIRDCITYLAVFALAWTPWQIISRAVLGINDVSSSLIFSPVDDVIHSRFDWPRVGAIVQYFLEQTVSWHLWGLTFPLTAAGLIVLFFHDRRAAAVFASLIAGNFLVQLVTYYTTVYLDEAQGIPISGEPDRVLFFFLDSGWNRMTMHWAPLGIYGAGMAIIALLRRDDASTSIPSTRPA